MADFLTALAVRTLGLMPETRPNMKPPFASPVGISEQFSPTPTLAEENATRLDVHPTAPPAYSQVSPSIAPKTALEPASLVSPAELSLTTPTSSAQSQQHIQLSSPRLVRPPAEPDQSSQPQPSPVEHKLAERVRLENETNIGQAQDLTNDRQEVTVRPRSVLRQNVSSLAATSFKDEAVPKSEALSPTDSPSRVVTPATIQRALQPDEPVEAISKPTSTRSPSQPLVAPPSTRLPAATETFSSPLVPPAQEPIAARPPAIPMTAPSGPDETPSPRRRPTDLPEQPAPPLESSPEAPSTIRPRLAPPQDAAGSQRNGDQAPDRRQSQQPPTIQVTIGRIEVRAIPAPEPPPLPQAPARRRPAISLDDYLAKRREAKR